MNNKFDLTIYLVEALSTNKRIWKDIDEIYRADKYRFYNAAKKSDLYNHQIITEGSIEKEIYSKRILGILLESLENDLLFEKIIRMIKKGYPLLYPYIEKNEEISVYEYLHIHLNGRTLDEASTDEINAAAVVCLSIANLYKRKVKEDAYFIDILRFRLEHYKSDNRYSINSIHDIDKKNAADLKKRIEKKTGQVLEGSLFSDKCRDNPMLQPLSDSIALLFDLENMSIESILDGIPSFKNDTIETLVPYVAFYKNKNVDEALKYYYPSHIIRMLIRAYKHVKDIYFKNHQETLFSEVESLEKEIKDLRSKESEIISIKTENERLKKTAETIEKRLTKIHNKELSMLKNENHKLNKQIIEYEKNKIELDRLREFVFSIQAQDKIKTEHTENDTISFKSIVNDINILIVGGTDSWQKKMRTNYPSINFLDGFMTNFSLSVLDSVDYVFFYWGYMSHAVYNKLMDRIRKQNIHFDYLDGTNIDLIENQIIKKINNE